MTEAAGGSARAEMEHRIVQRSIEDDAFRQQLLEDPRAAVEQELGARLPEEVRVETVEETAETIYLVLPSTSMAGAEGGALSDKQLESVAGGWDMGGVPASEGCPWTQDHADQDCFRY
jgi:Nitrile hydratase, alpha chain